MEERASEIMRQEMGEVDITLSHNIGRLGLLERENATLMNASLAQMSKKMIDAFEAALKQLKIKAPFYISQNDGTLMNAGFALKYPVLTFASGPTNSMRGAAYLSGLENAIVADIGGTTTDLGVLVNGYPRESSVTVDIGGVRTNFRMPDILALGLGGGSHVADEGGMLKIGPKSVGYRLLEEGRIFGGKQLTTSDIAVAAGYADFGDKSKLADLSEDFIEGSVAKIHQMIAAALDRMKINADPVPLILVGGGAVLVGREIAGTSEVIIPDNATVANAIGASIAQIGGEIDKVYSYDEMGRKASLKQAKKDAILKAIAAGADEKTVKILDVDETPLAYVPGGAVRVRIKTAGDLLVCAKEAG